MQLPGVVLLTGALVTLLTVLPLIPLAGAQVTVDFVVPHGISLTAGPNGDVLRFTGGAVGESELGSCGAAGTFPIQDAVLGKGGVPTLLSVTLTNTAAALQPGTHVSDLSFLGDCVIGDSIYSHYRGTVQ